MDVVELKKEFQGGEYPFTMGSKWSYQVQSEVTDATG